MPDDGGRFNHFRLVQLLPNQEDRSIYWRGDTGAHSVIGAIRAMWAHWEWQRGKLGYPISEELQDGNGRKSFFQYGFIRWTPGPTGAVVTTYDHSPETLTDRCSGDVAFPPVFGGPPIGPNTVGLVRGADGYTDWTPIFQVGLDDGGRVRWYCHSTTGNFLDPGTWRLRDPGGVACQFNGSGTIASDKSKNAGSGTSSCSTTVNVVSSDSAGWTAEQSRCNDHTNMFRARLGPDRLLETLCVETVSSGP